MKISNFPVLLILFFLYSCQTMDLSDEQVSESSENFIIPESEILKFAEEIYLPEPSKHVYFGIVLMLK